MPVDVKALRELAEKATPGPWSDDESALVGGVYSDDVTGSIVARCGGVGFEYAPRPKAEIKANAAFIAAANPSAVLALLDEIERKDRALQPFADIGAWLFARDLPDDTPMVEIGGLNGGRGALTRGDFKEAHRALSPATPMEEMSNETK